MQFFDKQIHSEKYDYFRRSCIKLKTVDIMSNGIDSSCLKNEFIQQWKLKKIMPFFFIYTTFQNSTLAFTSYNIVQNE